MQKTIKRGHYTATDTIGRRQSRDRALREPVSAVAWRGATETKSD
jgi:hypothetical protein